MTPAAAVVRMAEPTCKECSDMTTADHIAKEVAQLPEALAAEVLEFVRFLRCRHEATQREFVAEKALDLLDHPPLNLGGQYLTRAACHDRAGLR